MSTSAAGSTNRLTEEREREIYAAVLELLQEDGYKGLTMPAVAVRTRCSTATIYRRWQGKVGLVTAALANQRPEPLPDEDTGSLRGDLLRLFERMARSTPKEAALMTALAHAATADEEIAAAMRNELGVSAGGTFEKIVDRAVGRGEVLADNPARRFCQDMMLSIGMSRQVIQGAYPDFEYLAAFADAVLIPSLSAGASPVGP